MAEKIIRQTLCDLHLAQGEEVESVKTIPVMLDGESVEIDLCLADAVRLQETLAPVLKVGRPAKPVRQRTRSPKAARSQSEQIRAWAEQQPHLKGTLKSRGRVPAPVKAEYFAAARRNDQLQNGR